MDKLAAATNNLAQPVKGTTWKSLILDIKEGSYKDFPLKNRSTIASLISTVIKLSYPDRVYKINTKDSPGVLRVYFIKPTDNGN